MFEGGYLFTTDVHPERGLQAGSSDVPGSFSKRPEGACTSIHDAARLIISSARGLGSNGWKGTANKGAALPLRGERGGDGQRGAHGFRRGKVVNQPGSHSAARREFGWSVAKNAQDKWHPSPARMGVGGEGGGGGGGGLGG